MKGNIYLYFILFVTLFLLTGCFIERESQVKIPTCLENQTLVDNVCVDNETEIPTCTATQTLIDNVCVENEVDDGIYTLEELQDDFDELISLIYEHNLLQFTDLVELEAVIAQQELLIVDGMSNLEFTRILLPIISAINCRHTFLFSSEATAIENFNLGTYLPMNIQIIDDKLYVTTTNDDLEFDLGDEIISINGFSAEYIITSLINSQPSDGGILTGKYARVNREFLVKYHFQIDSLHTSEIEYRHLGSDTVLTTTVTKIDISPTSGLTAYYSSFEDNYAILTINSFSTDSNIDVGNFYTFFDSFFTSVNSLEIENVILDIRNNGGGDPRVSSKLFFYLALIPQRYYVEDQSTAYPYLTQHIQLHDNNFNGNLYTIMSGYSSSSTGHLLALLKYQQVGVFIGEESGGSFATSSDTVYYYLENTNIRFKTSTSNSIVEVNGIELGSGILPDYEIYPTLDDYLYDDEDSIMDFVIDLIENP